MNLNSGNLYFIRERDVLTGAEFDYYKIGLVKHSRQGDAEARLDEHQTGNPRQLVIVEQVSAPAVSDLESTVHGRFATHRVLGEWFELTPQRLAEVVAVASALAEEQIANLDALDRAAKFKDVESNGETRPATDTDLEWWRRLGAAKFLGARITMLRQTYEPLFSNAIDEGRDLRLFAGFTEKTRRSFDKDKFAESHPDLYAEFTFDVERMAQRFTFKAPKAEVPIDLDAEFLDLERRLQDLIMQAQRGEPDFDDLHLRHLELLRWQTEADWQREIAEANLRAACGTDAGIEDVVTWNRERKVSPRFDDAALRTVDPDLHAQFVVEVPTRSFAMIPMRSYALPTD